MILPLDGKPAVHRHHRGKCHRHPEDSRREIDRSHRGRVAREVEHDEQQGREHRRREKAGAAPQFGTEILGRNRQREPQALKHARAPGTGTRIVRATRGSGFLQGPLASSKDAYSSRQIPGFVRMMGDEYDRATAETPLPQE